MKHTFYGDLQGRFVGKGAELFKRAWWIWTVCVFGAVTALALIGPALQSKQIVGGTPRVINNNDGTAGLIIATGVLLVLFVAPVLYGFYKGIQWKWWLEGLRLGELRPASSLKATSFIGNYCKAIGLTLAAMVVGGIAQVLVGLSAERLGAPWGGVVLATLPAYLATLLAIGVIWRVYFVQRVFKIVISSLTLDDIEAAQDVSLRVETTRPTALGEGFADSLDVIGF